jgi:type IV secretory pathway VirB10-like protein
MSESVISPAPKVDPETLAIRTKPARAIRFRRGVIIAIAALGSVSLIAVAWIALKPRVFSTVADRRELSEPSNRPSTDALNGLPATYGDAPKLGPPLPGDLGRPILKSQRRMPAETGTGSDPSVQQAAQERERQL